MRIGLRVSAWIFSVALLSACGEDQTRPEVARQAEPEVWVGTRVDTIGVRNLAEGDTLNQERGLTVVETTGTFPGDGEVFAWEFYAQRLRPVKLIIVRYDQGREYFELVGESETIIPERIGVNRFVLRERIPVGYGCMFGVVQPEESAIPFRKIRNWKAMITMRPFERPLMRRDWFAVYGWRYAVRVYWRQTEEGS